MEFPSLYGNVSKGDKIKVWNVQVTFDKSTNIACIVRTYGQLGGKQAQSTKEISKGKNIGRANETTAFKQACNEAQSLWNKQKECGYVEDKNLLESAKPVTTLPMLAHDYTKRGKDVKLESAYVQPKLDGVRMMVSKDCKISRTGKQFTSLTHLDYELSKLFSLLPQNIILDGELFTFDLPFEDISGCVRQSKNVDTHKVSKLMYHIYDCYLPDNQNLDFVNRFEYLQNSFCKEKFHTLVLVDTHKVDDSIENLHTKFVSQGFEGIMLRNAEGVYKLNYRSIDLQKYKCFIDSEYTICDVKEATGNDKGTAIFVCKHASTDETFSFRPRGSRDLRATYWNQANTYIGKKLTVRYQNLSEYGIPRFPVGIAIRDYE